MRAAQSWKKVVYAKPVRRRLPEHVRLCVFLRDGRHCQVVGCDAKRNLEVHHVLPVAEGGTDDTDNLTVLCRKHHDLIEDDRLCRSLAAIRAYGPTEKPSVILADPPPADDWRTWVYGGAKNPAK